MAIVAVGYTALPGFGLGNSIRHHHGDRDLRRFNVRSRLLCGVYLNLGLAGTLQTFMGICVIQHGGFGCQFKLYRGKKSFSKITRRDRRCNVYCPIRFQLPKSCKDIRRMDRKAKLGKYVVYPQGSPRQPRRRHCNPYTFRGFMLPKTCKDIYRSKRNFKTGNNVIYPLGSWGRPLNVYCHKLKGIYKTYVTLKYKNWSEFGKHHQNGLRWDFGAKVTFKKIQINVMHDGKITKEYVRKPTFADKRFSRHRKTLPAYGVAASAHPQQAGDFKIDLRGTGLKVSSETKWKGRCKTPSGTRSAKHMNLDRSKGDDVITGNIRGYDCFIFPRPSKYTNKWR